MGLAGAGRADRKGGGRVRIETILSSQKCAVVMVALIGGGFLLLSIFVTTFLSPVYGLVEIGILVGGLVALYFALSLRKFVWLLLVTKPLIDLPWRWRFVTVAEQGVNIQTLVGVLVIIATVLAVFFWGRRLVVDMRVILFLTFASLSVLLTPVSGDQRIGAVVCWRVFSLHSRSRPGQRRVI